MRLRRKSLHQARRERRRQVADRLGNGASHQAVAFKAGRSRLSLAVAQVGESGRGEAGAEQIALGCGSECRESFAWLKARPPASKFVGGCARRDWSGPRTTGRGEIGAGATQIIQRRLRTGSERVRPPRPRERDKRREQRRRAAVTDARSHLRHLADRRRGSCRKTWASGC